jgi:hypothetical protein
MTAGGHEMPPHLVRYLDSFGDPAASIQTAPPGIWASSPLSQLGLSPQEFAVAAGWIPDTAPSSAIQADGHVDPAAAARWHQAQTELVGLIREENRVGLDQPEAERRELLPDSLGDWTARRVCELEEAEADQPEAEL